MLWMLFLFFVEQKEDTVGTPTSSAHPARFSPDDKFSRERIIGKKRFNLLPTQVSYFLPFLRNFNANIITIILFIFIATS